MLQNESAPFRFTSHLGVMLNADSDSIDLRFHISNKFPDGTTATDLKQQDFKEYIHM